MRRTHWNVLFLFAACLFVALSGCGKGTGLDLSSDQSAMIEDSNAVDDTEQDVETGIEDALSGALPADIGTSVLPASTDQEVSDKIRTNPGLFFQPAGCIVSTLSQQGSSWVVTHVFTNCTGPLGLTSFNGTVTSTWTKMAGPILSVRHQATQFSINQASITFDYAVTYQKSDTNWTKTRKGSLSGATAKGKTFSHTLDYTVTFNSVGKCVTRNGTSTTTIDGRTFSRSISDFERCGVGTFLGLCPKSGTITLTGPNSNSLTITFDGSNKVLVTLSSGKSGKVLIICRAN